MRKRCRSTNSHNYPRYGGRGITICNEWDSFAVFLRDMGPRPEDTSLDRIDNAGNYELSNCRWATTRQQARNQRRAKKLTAELVMQIKTSRGTESAEHFAKLAGVCVGYIYNLRCGSTDAWTDIQP